ncbi:MAG: hypothetical protein GX639_16690 [Fibrobacter sp.]|nr:hypothetical protein [Fibrobacter sp.]
MIDAFRSITQFAAQAQQRLIIAKIIERIVMSLGVLSVVAAVLNILFIVLPFSIIIYVLDVAVVLPLFIVIYFCVLFIWIKRVSRFDALRYLEKQSGTEHGVVSIAFEIRDQAESVFTRRAAEIATSQIPKLKASFPSFCTRRAVLVFCIGMVLFTSTSLLESSAIHYVSISDLVKNKKIEYVVKPGSARVAKGGTVVLSMECNTTATTSCWLLVKDISTGKTNRKMIHKNSMDLFSDTLDNVTKSIQYQFMVMNRKINRDSIIVVQPPVIQSIALTITNPGYMNRKDTVVISGNGNASVYRGATIGIELESSFLKSAQLVINNDTTVMIANKRNASSSFNVIAADKMQYAIILTDTMGQKNEDSIHYEITVIPDELPAVQITEPAFNKNLTPDMIENVAFEAVDDFGIRSAALNYFISSNRVNVAAIKLSPKKSVDKYQKKYIWDLNKTGLYPGDTLFYFVKVLDNYPYKPHHSASSDTYFFRIPSFEEISKGILEKEKHAEQLLKHAIDNAGEIRKTTDKVQSESKRGSENPSWEQNQLLDEMKDQTGKLRDSLQNAVDALNQSAKELRKQGGLGNELADKMKQIEKMIEKLAAKYGDSLFTDIDKNQKITAKQLQEAAEKAKSLLPDLEKALENTLKYLEAMQKDRELAELSMKAENLARQQVALNERETDDSRVQQDQVIRESEALNNDISNALDQNSNRNIDSLLNQIDSLGKKIRSRKQNASLMDKSAATAMSQSLMSLADELREMMSDAQAIRAEAELKKVLAIAGMLLSVNDWIEELGRNKPDDKTVGMHLQVFFDALRNVQGSIDSLELVPPEILIYMTKQVSTILSELQKIVSTFDHFQTRSLDNISSLMLVLANDLMAFASPESQPQNNGDGGGGMMSKMRKLSQRQSGVNAATSAMLRALLENSQGMQPGASDLSSDSERMRVEAARNAAMERQQEIADELEKLQKMYSGDNVNNQIVKRLDELKQEAQRLTEMFKAPSEVLEEKQNEFLNRMLQSALSVNRRDEEKEERKSESARTLFFEQRGKKVQVPATPDAFYLMKRKALQGNFPETYRSVINAYLDSLGVLYLKDK